MKNIRLILIDDHSIVREGLRMMLENDPGIEVAGEADNMDAALELIDRERPGLVLLDLDLGGEFSLDRIEEIFRLAPGIRVLVLTGVTDEDIHRRVIRGGAHGIVLKSQAGATLLKAVRKVSDGEVWIDRALTARVLAETVRPNDNDHRALIGSLTPREREIVKLIAEGLVNKEIAARLYIGEKTVRNSLTTIYSKLGVSNRLELAVFASQNQGDFGF